MANIFLISDTHFGHGSFLTFKRHVSTCPELEVQRNNVAAGIKGDHLSTCGCPTLRSFASVEEMDETMIDNWNAVVRPQDKVYHLGDVSMRRDAIATVGRCKGHKRLVRGNHDDHDDKHYRPFFESIYGTRVLDKTLILSHIPIHESSIKPGWTNIHGHVHNNVPKDFFGPRYFNMCVEYHNYTPVALEEVKRLVIQQQSDPSVFREAMVGLKL